MKNKPPATPIPKEDVLIRELLSGQRFLMRSFQPEMESAFWRTLAERSTSMINGFIFPGAIVYLILGVLNLPIVYYFSWSYFRTQDLYNLAYMYAIGILCLGTLPALLKRSFFHQYFYAIMGTISFFGVLSTSYFSLQFKTPWVSQAATYDVVLVYILVYFIIGMKPRFIFAVGLSAGLLALAIAYFRTANFDFIWYSNEELVRYVYYVGLINLVGLVVSTVNIAKERVSFLQSRLLELDKLQAEDMSDKLTRLSREDPVTGLANRRYFNERMDEEWERAQRSGEPLSVLFIDIDHFKTYNDTYGHLQGDEALHQVAQTLKLFLHRSTDLAARYGGEEFLVLLPNTPVAGAKTVADKVLAAVDALNIEHKKSKTAKFVTVSIGVSTCSFVDSEVTIAELINQADEAVYKAKADGRHRVREYHRM
ncbi:GGDEF domain-containing protein [Aquirhabdus parva]|uniref:diguanylate cyclase n=1 Tax=Aquirhabdus parva TaxID=2283318 RepID=A0A345P759_9GAMM|nr:diguanylate cyclase [Aquirhabdus parva]AXI03118.1 GGDEF domain-containing protein [Aquirhabdus parva]